MIKEMHCHPHSHVDARGEEILLSIHKFATILGDHVANTDIHVLSLITNSEIDELVDDIIADTDSSSVFDGYYTKDDIDQMGFIKSIPNEYITEEELELYIAGLKIDLTKELTTYITETANLENYYDKDYINNTLSFYAKQDWVNDKIANFATKSYVDSKSSTVTIVPEYTNTDGVKIATINNTAIYAPAGSGSSDGYLYDGRLSNTTLVLNVRNHDDVTVDLSSLQGGTSYIPGSGGSNKSYFSVSVYKAVVNTVTSVDKPSATNYSYNYSTGTWNTNGLPSGWYESPEAAKTAYSTTNTNCIVWVSHNNLCNDSTSTGWTTPVKYLNIDQIIDDAKDAAQAYYESQIEDTESELSTTINDAKDKLEYAQLLVSALENNEIDSVSINSTISKLKNEIKTYGWEITNGTVNYVDQILTPTKFKTEISKTNPSAGSVGAALRSVVCDEIKDKVYNYANGKIDETYLKLTPTQVVLSAIGGTVGSSNTVDNVQSALLNLVKDNITLSVTAKTENGTVKGTSFKLGFNGKTGTSEAILDTTNFILTGDMIANAVHTNGVTINNGASSINKEGDAYFATNKVGFKKDGSGYLAGGNVKWEKNGDLTINANGTFNGTVNADNGVFKGDVIAKTFQVLNKDGNPGLFMSTYGEMKSQFSNDTTFNNLQLTNDDPLFIYNNNGIWHYIPFNKITGTTTVETTTYTSVGMYVLEINASNIYPALRTCWTSGGILQKPGTSGIPTAHNDTKYNGSYITKFKSLYKCISTDSSKNGKIYTTNNTTNPFTGIVIDGKHTELFFQAAGEASGVGTHTIGYYMTTYKDGEVVNSSFVGIASFYVNGGNSVDWSDWVDAAYN